MKKPRTRTSRSWRDADSWAQLLAGHEASGLSVKEYCATQGISAASFYRWQKRLKQEEGVGFSPIEIETKAVGGLVVELPGGVCLRFRELSTVWGLVLWRTRRLSPQLKKGARNPQK